MSEVEIPTYVPINKITPFLPSNVTERTRRKILFDAGVVRQVGRRRWVSLPLLDRHLPEAYVAFTTQLFMADVNAMVSRVSRVRQCWAVFSSVGRRSAVFGRRYTPPLQDRRLEFLR